MDGFADVSSGSRPQQALSNLSTSQQNALHLAALQGDVAATQRLLDDGARVDIVCKTGRTPLHEASAKGHEAIVSLLLDHGAGADLGDREGDTPLILAAAEGHEAVVRSILSSKRADIHHQNEWKWTALHLAACRGHVNMVELLIDHGAIVDARDWSGKTAMFEVAASGHLEVAKALLKHNADVNATDKSGSRPLHGTVYEKMIKLLLDHHAEIDAEDHSGQTALRLALGMGYKYAVELLLRRGANVHTTDTDGNALLHETAVMNRAALIPKLLELEVDPAAKNRYGFTAYDIAIQLGRENVAGILRPYYHS